MLIGLDHIVIAVSNLEAAIASYRELGFTVIPGGRHPVGTHNGLISFADGSYIEIIAFYRENPDHRWWGALQKGGGLVDFCMQTDDLTGDTLKLRNAGVNIADPVPWMRTRPDGYRVKWLLSLAAEPHRGVAPFLIQDVTPRDERVPREVTHKNGAIGISIVTTAVDDLAGLRRWYKSALGYEGKPLQREELNAEGVRFRIGPHFFDFLRPLTEQSPLAAWIKTRGPSPYAATLRTRSGQVGSLDPALTHGAALSFE
ncbi:MAG: VOC family protein [Deltaproteobacteria bacterium]|nr:VOC family protein [Deltaproteobacteria bacterium]MBI2349708.1 VOC family protein [Deltaproteobacteria bacterium]MBI2538713.1 VOC family protein [Deltaproteobacteria bacterium]MBI2992445.1 VOC family protein [Deltaproteobacteria bacterium]